MNYFGNVKPLYIAEVPYNHRINIFLKKKKNRCKARKPLNALQAIS
jgi:hypothetical protein